MVTNTALRKVWNYKKTFKVTQVRTFKYTYTIKYINITSYLVVRIVQFTANRMPQV